MKNLPYMHLHTRGAYVSCNLV